MTGVSPTVYVDADACPVLIRDMLYRAAQRTGVALVLVANQAINVPRAPNIRALRVPGGFDAADDEIVSRIAPGDLVVTADIPLAAQAIERGAQVVTPRGEVYDAGNVRARLGMRDFLDTLRGSGIHTGGPPPLHERDRRAFAGVLDRYLASLPRPGA